MNLKVGFFKRNVYKLGTQIFLLGTFVLFNNCTNQSLQSLSQIYFEVQRSSFPSVGDTKPTTPRLNPLTLTLPQNSICPQTPVPGSKYRYISPAGKDSNNGLSKDSPLRTLGAAINASSAGDILILADGVYREGIETSKGGAPGSPLTIRAEAGAKPIIAGSTAGSGWTESSPGIWQITWDPNVKPSGYSGPESVTRHAPQQVFVDGAPLQQIGGIIDSIHPACPDPSGRPYCRKAVGSTLEDLKNMPGSFFFDPVSFALYVHLVSEESPLKHLIEISAQRRILFFYSDSPGNVCIEGLTFHHSNSSASSRQMAAVTIPISSTLANSTVEWADLAGLSLYNNSQVFYSTLSHNGQLGITPGFQNFTIKNNLVYGNNYRYFNNLWEAGGIKATSGATGKMIGNHVYDNEGAGIWLDYAVGTNPQGVTIDGNFLHGNGREAQIFIEVSPNVKVLNNIVVNDGRTINGVSNDPNVRAIYISESTNNFVLFNTVVKMISSLGIDATTTSRGSFEGLQILGNIVYDISSTVNSVADLRISGVETFYSDYNSFFHSVGSPAFVYKGNLYTSLSAWYAASGKDMHSPSSDPLLVLTSQEFQIRCSSAAKAKITDIKGASEDILGISRILEGGSLNSFGAFQNCL